MEATVLPDAYVTNDYLNLLVKASATERRRILLGIPVTGLVRMEWVLGRYGQIIPCNWSMAETLQPLPPISPLGYDVKDARNAIVHAAVQGGFEWLLFVDHDTILPPGAFLKINAYMLDGRYPIVAGLYFTRSEPSEPLIYRGRGNSYFRKWAFGDKVWCDGCGMGCTLLSVKLLKAMWDDAPVYTAGGNAQVRMVFDTPQFLFLDPEQAGLRGYQGTEDLSFFDRMRAGDYLAKAGFKTMAKKRWPVLVDTSLFCRHIDPDGTQYPRTLTW
jgi:hypothetical protein